MTTSAALKTSGSAPATKLPNFKTVMEQDTTMVILPDPVGYSMLVALPTMKEQTDKGVYIPDTVNERERAATVMGTVLAMGEMCYKDMRKFGIDMEIEVDAMFMRDAPPVMHKQIVRRLAAPWCKVGDTVLFSRYSGMRFKSMDKETGAMVEYRMLSDDQIVGTVPEGAQVGGL